MSKSYEVDTDKIKDLDDVKKVLKAMNLHFHIITGKNEELFESIKHLLGKEIEFSNFEIKDKAIN